MPQTSASSCRWAAGLFLGGGQEGGFGGGPGDRADGGFEGQAACVLAAIIVLAVRAIQVALGAG